MTPCRQPTGFTLVELLIVLAVMGILVGLAMPSSEPGLIDQLRAAAPIVAADLAYGRSLAVGNNSNYRFSFDLNNNRYTLEHSGSNTALNPLPKSPYQIGASLATQHVVDLDDLPRMGSAVRLAAVAKYAASYQSVTTVEFGSLGQTTRSEPTTIWLSAGAANNRRYIALTIDAVTGLVEIGTCTTVGPPPEVATATASN